MTLRLLLPPSVGAARARARAEFLDQSLRADIAEAVDVAVADDYSDLAARVEQGEADMVWMPPTLCARLEPELHSLHKCVRLGRSTYRSAIVARVDEITNLSELRGKRLAWVDRLSVGGHLLALEALVNAGIDPGRDLAGQLFTGSYPGALSAVIEGRADAAALTVRDDSGTGVRESLASYGGKSAVDALRAVHVTGSSPNDGVGLTLALEARRAGRIARRVFEGEGTRARAALCLALDAEGFVRASPGEYASLRRLLP